MGSHPRVRRAQTRSGALDEIPEPEPGEQLSVPRSAEIHRELSRQLGQRSLAGIKRGRNPHRQPGTGPAGRGCLGVDPGAHHRHMLGRDEVQDELVGEAGANAGHVRTERRDGDRRLGLRAAQLEAASPNMVARDVDALTVEQRPERHDALAHVTGKAAPRPVVPAADDRRTRRAQRDVDGTSDERRDRGDAERDRDGAADADRERPDLRAVHARSAGRWRWPGRTRRTTPSRRPTPTGSRPDRPCARSRRPPRRDDRARTGSQRRGSQHRGVGGLIEQQASAQLPRRRVDLEVRGGGMSVPEAALQRRVGVDRRAAAEVVHGAGNVGRGAGRVRRREPNARSAARPRPTRTQTTAQHARRRRPPGSRRRGPRAAPPRSAATTDHVAERWASVRLDPSPTL